MTQNLPALSKDSIARCALDSLSLYGESMRAALMVHLEKEGISFAPESFDVEKFCTALESLLGSWAEFVCMKMINDLCDSNGVSLEGLGMGNRSRYLSYSDTLKEVIMRIQVA